MNDYSEEILRKLKNLKPQFPEMNIKRLRVFGSVVRGEAEPGSDIDLIVDLSRPVGLFEFAGMAYDLEGRLGVKVDLVTQKGLHPALKNDILSEAQDV